MAADILRHDLWPLTLVLAAAQQRCHDLEAYAEKDKMMASHKMIDVRFKAPMCNMPKASASK